MFEFEDDDFSRMENFSFFTDDNPSLILKDQMLVQATYLGDGVWVLDDRKNTEELEPTHASDALICFGILRHERLPRCGFSPIAYVYSLNIDYNEVEMN